LKFIWKWKKKKKNKKKKKKRKNRNEEEKNTPPYSQSMYPKSSAANDPSNKSGNCPFLLLLPHLIKKTPCQHISKKIPPSISGPVKEGETFELFGKRGGGGGRGKGRKTFSGEKVNKENNHPFGQKSHYYRNCLTFPPNLIIKNCGPTSPLFQ